MSGIYVHIPFCKSKCTYCDFASYPREIGKADIYFACLYKEIKARAESLKDYVFDTIYFGGGTPSFVEEKYVLGALRQIKNYYKLSDDVEITLEVNPGTINTEKVKTYKKAGINRFSIGLQSADDKMLRSLNRIHNVEDFLLAAELLKGENLSVDVMLGLENQTQQDVKNTIDLAIKGGAKHISAYALKAEEGTPMYGKYLNGDLPSEDETAELYDFAKSYLESNGFYRYEVSNFARDGYKSRHNLNYWNRGEYIGFGVSASSFIGERRFTNTEKIDEYTACILRNKVAEIFSEEIEGEEREFEFIMLSLRKDEGFSLSEFESRFGVSFTEKYKEKLKITSKYIDLSSDRVKIKPEYIYVQNTIIIYFLD
jgi:oxygen-independent coproporphyrinogen-3 oxidase